MTPSPQQQAVLDFIQSDTRSLIVEARAGSGKTTTLVQIASVIPRHSLCVFLAFNKNIATELQSRLPQHIQAKTFHSHGFGALQRNLPRRPRVDGDKTYKILKDFLPYDEQEDYAKYINRLIGYGKNAGVGTHLLPNEHSEWYNLIDHYSLQLDNERASEERAVSYTMEVLDKSNADTSIIDFDDMLYLALLRRVTFDKCNFVMLDEAQDTNSVQRELLKSMLSPINGRLIAVGDPFQSIYGFRGADADAMELLRTTFSCETLPLSVSWRCSKSVIMEARKVLCA